jgi:hypothetical protein
VRIAGIDAVENSETRDGAENVAPPSLERVAAISLWNPESAPAKAV